MENRRLQLLAEVKQTAQNENHSQQSLGDPNDFDNEFQIKRRRTNWLETVITWLTSFINISPYEDYSLVLKSADELTTQSDEPVTKNILNTLVNL